MFDSGAKRTYMTIEVKWELNFVPFKQEKIAIKVFGKVEGSKCRRCKNHCGRSKKKCLCWTVSNSNNFFKFIQTIYSAISNNYPHLKNLELPQESNETCVNPLMPGGNKKVTHT